ncbi:H(+)-transporting V0 sector ATPase subunit e [Tulasnella sp. 419]|nr:H(+)-transporting V0 sector ATPase subunit e [Tulasnella sp. 418]KAG8952856.1 H(+)-transporting V0 sector ATPase subunit e [Tulasnella sp. 419]
MSGYSVLIVLLAALLLGAFGWTVTPKGQYQVLIRTSVLLTVACCYLMWAITYMAQLHPLIAPHRADIRFEN